MSKYVFTGDPRPGKSNPESITMTSRKDAGRKYPFELNGKPVDVHEDDDEQFANHSHFVAAKDAQKQQKSKVDELVENHSKDELLDMAEEKGLEVPANATKPEIAEALLA